MPADPEVRKYTAPGVQVLRVGTWNGREWTREELAAIVESSKALARAIVPRITLDHDESETRRMGGGPALGFVQNLRLADGGDTLVGDFTDIPRALAKAIELKGYGPRSVEAFFNVSFYGEVFPAVLTAVSFLGRDLPAVDGLADIERLYADDDSGEVLEVGPFGPGVDAELSAALLSSSATRHVAIMSAPAGEPHQESNMDAIKEALGLSADADEAAIVAAIAAQKEGSVPLTQLREALGLGEDVGAEGVLAAVAPKPEPEPEPAPEAELSKLSPTVLAMLKKGQEAHAELARIRSEKSVDALIDEGKVAPAERDAFVELATEAPERFAALSAKLVPSALLNKRKGHAHDAPTDDEREVDALMDAYKAANHPNPPTRDECVAMLRKHRALSAGQES